MKVVLTIAGSDSSGGAGIQADLKTFEAFGVFGTSAITVLTAQNTKGVNAVKDLHGEFIKAQLQAIQEDFEIAAVKVGMLFNKEIIECVAEFLDGLHVPIVLDPVCISKANSPLLQEDAIESLKKLFPLATVITPNAYEAKLLFGYEFGDTPSLANIMSTNTAVLVKNQTLTLADESKSVDQLFYKHQRRVFETPKVDTNNLHGTGCSYSSAIAANLALGHSLEESVAISKRFIYEALLSAPNVGHGAGPINHKMGGFRVS